MNYNQWLLALCLFREARGSSKPALMAIRAVIENRVADAQHRWPKSIPAVITQKSQFSSFSAGDPNATKFPLPPIPETAQGSPDWQAWLDCADVASVPLGADPTNGANGYVSLVKDPATGELVIPPAARAWATPERQTCAIGAFRFFRV